MDCKGIFRNVLVYYFRSKINLKFSLKSIHSSVYRVFAQNPLAFNLDAILRIFVWPVNNI